MGRAERGSTGLASALRVDRSVARRIGTACADIICPERCAACPTVVVATALFCAECRREINVLGDWACIRNTSPKPRKPKVLREPTLTKERRVKYPMTISYQ